MTDVIIRPLQTDDFEAWLPLWLEYHLNDVSRTEKSQVIFDHLMDPLIAAECLLAIKNGKAVGIAHIVYHFSTYINGKNVAYLEDLGVMKEERGQGIGKYLINESIKRAKEKGSGRFYWITTPDNEKAQRLYDTYTDSETWLRYAISL
jgi:GNAT superfamily N-acetyltransferase